MKIGLIPHNIAMAHADAIKGASRHKRDPMKLRMPTKLGYKNPKHIVEIFVTNTIGGHRVHSGVQLVRRILSAESINGSGLSGCHF